MLLDTLSARLLGNILADKGMNRSGEGFIRAGYGFSIQKQGFLIPPHSLNNFEVREYYQNQSRFNCVYSRDNLSDKINNGKFVINFDKFSDIGTHWIALHALNYNVTYFHSFALQYIPKEIKVIVNLQYNLDLLIVLVDHLLKIKK